MGPIPDPPGGSILWSGVPTTACPMCMRKYQITVPVPYRPTTKEERPIMDKPQIRWFQANGRRQGWLAHIRAISTKIGYLSH
jgi:hypothetical protein